MYNKTVCFGEVYKDTRDIRYCNNLGLIIKEHNTSDYWNPFNCTDSCSDPGYSCLACTNQKYFQCIRDNLRVCIHPQLVCNHHPDCDNVGDEEFEVCYSEYVRKGLVDEFATLKCPSKIYPDMITVATVCDGIEECYGGEDEPKTCLNSNGFIFLGVSLAILLGIYLI